MLLQATALLDLFAMAITLWLAFYLFARGFPSRVTLRAVIVLLALSVFFFGAYRNIFHQVPGTAAWRAVLLVIGLASWYSLTYQIMSLHTQKQLRWLARSIYVLAAIAAVLLVSSNSFIGEAGNALSVAHMRMGIPYIVYSLFQAVVSFCILLNLLIGDRVGLTPRGKYFLASSLFPAASVLYGVAGLATPNALPRLTVDLLIFCGVFLLSLSVARHQTLLERRTTLRDFPVTTLTILGLAGIYAYIAWQLGLPAEMLAFAVGLAILTHAFYDLVREFLERIRIRREGAFRKQLRQLETAGQNVLQESLQDSLDLLCHTMQASGGLIAVREGEHFRVIATRYSIPVDNRIPEGLVSFDEVCQPEGDRLSQLDWVAPSFDGQRQIAFIGIGKPQRRLEYSAGDLELLSEVADQIGTIVSLNSLRPQQTDQIRQLVAISQDNATELSSIAGDMLDVIATNPDQEFVKMVEEALRHLHDYIVLGQSPLADWARVPGDSHVERGRQLQQLLNDALETLRPAAKRPGEPLPRVWYNYVVLHDAYVEGAQNREIMARLYISEGTFNRTRRNALRGLARLLLEKSSR
ncbi:MAG TPA: hypothetical protein VK900_03735 [Anaerolineales bacterium]|nr:hypothetical protein [Anaerolineales bacterium]